MLFKPKKRLGQNFLIDNNIRNNILKAANFSPDDIVLEIGSGKGELTKLIAQNVKKVYAVEIDKGLLPTLESALGSQANAEIINKDILALDLNKEVHPRGKRIKVLGNIPYYISSPIIEYLLKHKERIEEIFLSLQKEFAARITAQPGSKSYGSFSCFVQYYASPKILFNINKNSFSPVPKVDSSFISLKLRIEPPVRVDDETLFFKIIRSSFNKRRKTLKNSLEGVVAPEKQKLFFEKYGVDRNIRPEKLSLADFANLANLSP